MRIDPPVMTNYKKHKEANSCTHRLLIEVQKCSNNHNINSKHTLLLKIILHVWKIQNLRTDCHLFPCTILSHDWSQLSVIHQSLVKVVS